MKTLLIIFITFGVVTPNIIFAQNNRISIQTGLFHCFFDKTPILNSNYLNKQTKPFNGLFYNSLSIQYQRKINAKNAVSLAYELYGESYPNVHAQLLEKVVFFRSSNTINATYSRYLNLAKKWEFTYGGGLDFRFGEEGFITDSFPFESFGLERKMRDVGVNLRMGIEYSPLKWLTLYSKFDLLTFVYVNQPANIKNFKKNNEVGNYPSYFDLSWQFGIGFNFGK